MAAEADAREPCLPKRKMSSMGVALMEGTFAPESNMLEPNVNLVMFFDRAPAVEALRASFEKNLWPHDRFNSCMEDGHWVRRHQQMDTAYHFSERTAEDEAAIDAYLDEVTLESLPRSHPAWKVVVIRASPPSRSAVVIRMHHSIGDGLGMVFAFSKMVTCEDGGSVLSKIPLPSLLLPPSARKPAASPPSRAVAAPKSKCSLGICSFFRGAFMALLTKPDSELSINSPLEKRTPFVVYNGQRAHYRFPPVPMSIVKSAQKRHACSVNDVLLAALTGTLRRYGAECRKDEALQASDRKLEFKSMMMIGLPRKLDENDLVGSLCNKMLFASCPLPIDDPTPDGRLARTVVACNDLKSAPYMAGLNGFTNFVKSIAPRSVLRKAVSETFSKHSLLVTNVPGATVPVSFPEEGGEEVREVQMLFPNLIPQFSIITYNGDVHGNLVADPALFPDMSELGPLWRSEIEALAGSQT